MGKRLWDLAKSRFEIATILLGHRHIVSDDCRIGIRSSYPSGLREWCRTTPGMLRVPPSGEPSVSGGDKRPPRAAAQSLTDSAHSKANKAKDTCRSRLTERGSRQSRSPRAAPSRGPAQYGRPRGAPRIAPPLKDSHDRSVARSASQPTRRSSTAGGSRSERGGLHR